jgi:hypothetical protein
MNALVLAFLLLLPAGFPAKHNCGCVKAKRNETTRQWGNEHIVLVDHKPYRQIQGTVFIGNKEKIENALVELFTHPEHLLLSTYVEREEAKSKQRRLAACKTGADGRFCFKNIPAGKYELRMSVTYGINLSSTYLILAPKNRKSSRKQLEVYLSVGT